MGRSVYDLDTRPDVHWSTRGLCRDNPDLWAADSWQKKAAAIHACGHCPVLAECAAERARTPTDRLVGMVMGGVAHNERGKPLRWPPAPVTCVLCAPSTVSLEARLRAPRGGG